MNEMRARPSEMDSLANTLRSGGAGLESIGTPPMANAGESIAVLAEAVGNICRASGGVCEGVHRTIGDIDEAKKRYMQSDERAIEELLSSGGDQ